MNTIREKLRDFIVRDGRAGCITIMDVRGSAPREAGTMMAVRADGHFTGTIGGGALEWQALIHMQRLLASHHAPAIRERAFALGPELGQCCGGRVTLRFEVLTEESLHSQSSAEDSPAHLIDRPASPVLLYGAGHVGRALVLALAPLPFRVTWIDARPEAFPAALPRNATSLQTNDMLSPITSAEDGTLLLAMTHSHALDLAICDAGLRHGNCRFVGVIGSETKRARFESQLRQAGHADEALDRLTCPIGDRSIRSKEPAVIAASVAVQLLKERERVSHCAHDQASKLPEHRHGQRTRQI